MSALFSIAKIRKQSHPSADGEKQRKCCSSLKREQVPPFDNTNETQNIPPCEVLQIEGDKYGLILIICGILTHQMQRNKGYNGENSCQGLEKWMLVMKC